LVTRLAEAPDAKLLDHLVSFGAWGYHEQALERCRQGKVGWNGPELLRVQGELLLRQGTAEAPAAAEAAFMEALELARKQAAHAWALRASNSLARLWLAQGRAGDALALLAPWLARLDAMGDSADARETRLLLDRR
jgi:predicted ATPase